jgi:hypothetical protein
MAKTFYTERDIEELARQGIRSLAVNDNVVLTELAVEKASRLGVNLVREHDTPPSAPIRPYIAAGTTQGSARAGTSPSSGKAGEQSKEELRQKVHAAVVARLGNEVDPALLDTIIRRVLDNIGAK